MSLLLLLGGPRNGTATPTAVAFAAVTPAPTVSGNATATPAAVALAAVAPAATSVTGGGKATPSAVALNATPAGYTLLTTMVGFWNASLYSGSGNFLNLGTGGSTGDFVLGPFPSVAPVFTGGNRFVFNSGGVDSMQFNANGTYHVPNKDAGSYSVGVVSLTYSTAFRAIMSENANNAWTIRQDTVTNRIQAAVGPLTADGDTEAVFTKALRGFVVDDVAHTINTFRGSTFGTSITDTRAVNPGVGDVFVAANPAGSTAWPGEVYGIFIHQGALDTTQLANIDAYFNGTGVGPVAIPAPAAKGDGTATPAAVTLVAVTPAATASSAANGTATPAAVTLSTVTVPAPTVTGGTAGTATPATVTLSTVTVPAPTVAGDAGTLYADTIAYIGVGSLVTATTGTTINLVAPACNVGDILIAQIFNKSFTTNLNINTVPPDGTWTFLAGAGANSGGADDINGQMYWKRATVSGGTFTFTKGTNDSQLFAGQISVWRGLPTSGGITSPGSTLTSGAVGGTGTSVSMGSIPVTRYDALAIWVVWWTQAATFTTMSSNVPVTTTRYSTSTAAGSAGTIAVATAPTLGADVAARSWTPTSSTAARVYGIGLFIPAYLNSITTVTPVLTVPAVSSTGSANATPATVSPIVAIPATVAPSWPLEGFEELLEEYPRGLLEEPVAGGLLVVTGSANTAPAAVTRTVVVPAPTVSGATAAVAYPVDVALGVWASEGAKRTVTDNFTGTNGNPWNPVIWQDTSASDIQSNQGRMVDGYATAVAYPAASCDLYVEATVADVSVPASSVGSQAGQAIVIVDFGAGTVTLRVLKQTPTGTSFDDYSTSMSFSNGDTIKFRLIVDVTVDAYVWVTGAQPSTPTLTGPRGWFDPVGQVALSATTGTALWDNFSFSTWSLLATVSGGVSAVNGTATPAAVVLAVSAPAATISGGSNTTPAAVARTVVVPAPTSTTGTSNATPAAVTPALTVSAPTLSASSNTAPATVSPALSVPAPTVTGGATATPASAPAAAAAPPAFRGVSTTVYWNGTATSQNLANPTGTAAGDLLIVLLSADASNSAVPDLNATYWTLANNVLGATQNTRYRVFTRTADLSANDNPTLTPSGACYGCGVKVAYSGLNATPIATNGTPINTLTVGGTTTGPALVAGNDTERGVSIACRANGTGEVWLAASKGTERLNVTGNWGCIQIVDDQNTSGNDLGSVVHNFVNGANRVIFGYLLNGVPAVTVVVVPAPTVTAGSNNAPATVSPALSVPAPTVSGGSNTTPAAVALVAVTPAPTTTGTANATPPAAALAVVAPAPTATGQLNGAAFPAAVVLAAATPAPTTSGSSNATPATVTLSTVTVPAPTVSGNGGTTYADTITFISAGTLVAATTGTTIDVIAPACNVDDILIFHTVNKSAVNVGTASTGWTGFSIVARDATGTTDDEYVVLMWRRAIAGDSGATFTATKNTNDGVLFAGTISAWRGLATSGSPLQTTFGNSGASAVGASLTFSQILASNSRYDATTAWFGTWSKAATFSAAMSPNTAPVATTRYVQSTTSGTEATLVAASGSQLGQLLIGTRTWTPDSGTAVGAGNTGQFIPAYVTSIAAVNPVLAVPDPAATGATNGNTTPATVSPALSVPAPSMSAGSNTSPATVTPALLVPAPTVTGGTSASTTPAFVSPVLSVPAPTLAAGSNTTPAAVTLAAVAPAPSVAASSNTTPAAVTPTAVVPAPTVTGTSNATPATVSPALSVPAPSVSASANTSPATVSPVLSVPAPTSTTGTSNATPAAVTPVLSVPAPALSAGSNTTPAAVARIVVVPAPTVTGTSNATPAAVARFAVVPSLTGAVAFVKQTVGALSAAAASIVTSVTSTGGNALMATVALKTGATQSVSSITDSAGNTWTKATASWLAGSNTRIEIWYVVNALAVTQVTVNMSTALLAAVDIVEFSNVVTASPSAGTATTSGTSTNPVAGAITPSQDNTVVIGAINSPGHVNRVLDASVWTSLTDFNSTSGSNDTFGSAAYLIQSTAGAVQASWSQPLSNSAYGGASFALKGVAEQRVTGGSNTTPAAVTPVLSVPAPSMSAGSNTTPAVVSPVLSVPAPAASGGTSVSTAPAAVALTAVASAPTLSAGSNTAPAAVTPASAVPAPSATGGTSVSTSPAAVTPALSVPAPTSTTGTSNAAPAAVVLAVVVPAPTLAASSNTTPTAIALAAVVPAASASAASTASPATVALTAVASAPALSGAASATPAAVALAAVAPAPTISASSITSPAAVAPALSVPAPTTTGGTTGNASPATVALAAVVPAPTLAAGSNTTPAAVTLVAAADAPATSADSTASPAAVTLTATLPPPSLSAEATATPATVTLTADTASPTTSADANTAPASIELTAVLEAATATGGAQGSATPATVALTATASAAALSGAATASPATVTTAPVTAPVTGTGTATVAPAAVARTVVVPAPFASGTEAGKASPAPVALTPTTPAPTVTGTANATPAGVAPALTTPAPAAAGGTTGTTSPAAVALVVVVANPVASAAASTTAATIALVAVVAAPSMSAGSNTAPGDVALASTVAAPSATGATSNSATPSTVTLTVTITTPSVRGQARTTPAAIVRTVVVPAAALSGTANVTPAAVVRLGVVPAPTGSNSGNATAATVTTTVTTAAPVGHGNARTTPPVVARTAAVPAAGGHGSAVTIVGTVTTTVTTPAVQGAGVAHAAPITVTLLATAPAPALAGNAHASAATVTLIATCPTSTIIVTTYLARVFSGGIWNPVPMRRWNGATWVADERVKVNNPATSEWISVNLISVN